MSHPFPNIVRVFTSKLQFINCALSGQYNVIIKMHAGHEQPLLSSDLLLWGSLDDGLCQSGRASQNHRNLEFFILSITTQCNPMTW